MISVAMATYNGENYIAEQLRSICEQTQIVDEIVIVDDCSTDGTVDVVQEYRRLYPEQNICIYTNEKNLGYKRNFQKAMSLCSGDIIFLCDQDDIWAENKVEVMVKILQIHEDVALVSSSFVQINGAGEEVSGNKNAYKKGMKPQGFISVPLEDLIFHNISQGCAMALRKEIKDLYLEFFTEELPHDWVLNIIAAMQKKCYYLNSPMFFYRIHDENTIGLNEGLTLKRKNSAEVRTHDAKQAIKVLALIKKMNPEFYGDNTWLEEMKRFSEKHIAYLEHRKCIRIMLQNFSPYYRKLKTVRGRLLDMFFCIK